MSRKPEVDKPLLEQPPSHLLQHLDPAPVHLDQVVVGAEDGGDSALLFEGNCRNERTSNCLNSGPLTAGSARHAGDGWFANPRRRSEVEDECWISEPGSCAKNDELGGAETRATVRRVELRRLAVLEAGSDACKQGISRTEPSPSGQVPGSRTMGVAPPWREILHCHERMRAVTSEADRRVQFDDRSKLTKAGLSCSHQLSNSATLAAIRACSTAASALSPSSSSCSTSSLLRNSSSSTTCPGATPT